MTDFQQLEAACRKKISAPARRQIDELIEACEFADKDSRMLGSALAFLLEREDQIDMALAAPPVPEGAR